MTTDREPMSTETDDAVVTVALRRSIYLLLCTIAVAGLVYWGTRPTRPLSRPAPETILPSLRDAPEDQVPQIPFTDITQEAGIDFVHCHGATGEKLLPETMGSGCAFFDFDQDEDADLLLVNAMPWPWDTHTTQPLPTTALYQNDGKGNFQNVSAETGMDVACYGTGVAVADYDNDGDGDVYIAAVGENRLLRNDNGRFLDVTSAAGVGGDARAWSTSCGWFDYDHDGDLDLLVGNYVVWSRELDKAQDFRLTGIGRAYGPPLSFAGTFPYLYRNEGNGTFTEVSAAAGLQITSDTSGTPLAKTLGIALTDVDRDGAIDIILANDTVRNLLFLNQTDGTFKEVGREAGIAFDATGKARGAMGIDTGFFRNDDTLGVVIANFSNEMTALYVAHDGAATFTDDALVTGLGPLTRQHLSFGILFFDADLDGRLDVLSANGHLEEDIHIVQASQHYRQATRLFWNAGPKATSEFVQTTTAEGASDLETPRVGRGAAYADIDGDGDLDIVLTQVAGRPALLRNDVNIDHKPHYLRLRLIGTRCNRDAIGALIEVHMKSGTEIQRAQVMPTRSYLSQVELPVTIGLGDRAAEVARIVVTWPDKSQQDVEDYQLDGTTIVEQPLSGR